MVARDYEVGYGKPPKNTRWKKGQSGNPKGRPKGRKNMATIMRDLLGRRVTMKENGQERRVAFSEAFVHQLAARALDGTTRDMIALMKAMHDYMPEALELDDPVKAIRIEFIDSDGQGRPADKERWKDCPPGTYAYESFRLETEGLDEGQRRDEDPSVIAAWKAAGLADEDDET